MMNILITGGSGFLGKHLVAALLQDGHKITLIGKEGSKDARINSVQCDLLDYDKIDDLRKAGALYKTDVVIHLAAIMPSKNDEKKDIVVQNATITKNVFSLVNPACFIFASSVDVYPRSEQIVEENTILQPLSEYGLSKQKSEEECLRWSKNNPNSQLLILRFSHLYGPADTNRKMIDNLMRNALLGKKSTILGEGNDKRTYLYVEDAVRAIQLCLQSKESGIFNLGGSKAYSVEEVISTLEKNLKVPLVKITLEKRTESSIVSSKKIADKIGFVPKVDLHDGLRKLIPKNIFFDMDGPILDVKERYYKVYKQFIIKHKGIPLSLADYWDQKRNKVSLENMLKLSKCEGVDETVFKKHLSKYREEISNLKLDKLQPKTKEILSHLSQNYNLYLITLRRNTENLFRQLEELSILTYFTKVLTLAPTSEDKWNHKVELLKEHHLDNQAGLILGDTSTEIMAAKNLGLTSIAVSNGIRTKEILLQAGPHLVIESIEEVCSLPFYSLEVN